MTTFRNLTEAQTQAIMSWALSGGRNNNNRTRWMWNSILKYLPTSEDWVAYQEWAKENMPERYKTVRWWGYEVQTRKLRAKEEEAKVEKAALSPDSVLAKLRVQLEDFRNEFVTSYVDWEVTHRENLLGMYGDYSYQDWETTFGVQKPGRSYKTISKDGRNMMAKVENMKRFSSEEWAARAKKDAEDYFEDRLIKLAGRATQHGFTDKVEVTGDKVGANINCWLNEGEQKMWARTIIASGPVIRPHYRFIIT